jgi:hypothetical protein
VKTIIKIIIAVALINAAARVGLAYAGFYQLKDQAQELVTFNGAKSSDGELQNLILAKAMSLNLPLDVSNIDVQHDGLHTMASTSYTQPVEVFPNYKYPLKFQFTVDAIGMSGLGANAPTPAAKQE